MNLQDKSNKKKRNSLQGKRHTIHSKILTVKYLTMHPHSNHNMQGNYIPLFVPAYTIFPRLHYCYRKLEDS
jgi:hypothetical protein